jgi:hypothetical protein
MSLRELRLKTEMTLVSHQTNPDVSLNPSASLSNDPEK